MARPNVADGHCESPVPLLREDDSDGHYVNLDHPLDEAGADGSCASLERLPRADDSGGHCESLDHPLDEAGADGSCASLDRLPRADDAAMNRASRAMDAQDVRHHGELIVLRSLKGLVALRVDLLVTRVAGHARNSLSIEGRP
jgi:hypothetical protein